jgi:hypothetical protein
MADGARIVQTVRGEQALTVRESITVGRSVAQAFQLFTDGIGEWWPLNGTNFSYGGDRADKIFLEAKTGGRLYERFTDGEEFEIGRVTLCEPPNRIVFSRYNPGHRGWEAAGADAVAGVSGWAEGWQYILARFVEARSRPVSG